MRTAGKRIIYGAIGIVATILAIIGVLLPGVPSTVFILLALWAFSNSSERLHKWMLRIPLLSTAIREARRFQRERTIDFRVKFISQFCSWASFVFVSITLQNLIVSLFVLAAAVSCTIFMIVTPRKQPKQIVTALAEDTKTK